MDWQNIDWKRTLLGKGFLVLYAILLLVVIILFVTSGSSKKDSVSSSKDIIPVVNNATNETELQNQIALQKLTIQDAARQLDNLQLALDACIINSTKDKNQSKSYMKTLGNDLANAQSDLKACQTLLEGSTTQSAIVVDAARRLCCIQRVDNPVIDSFAIENNKIVCKSGAENRLSC